MADTGYEDRDDERAARDEAEQHLREGRRNEQPDQEEDERAESLPDF